MAEMLQSDRGDRANWETAALFLCTLVLLTVCAFMLYPFLPAITGAVVLTILTRRPQRWWRSKVHNRTAAAASALLLVTISIIGPLLLLLQYLIRHAVSAARMLQDGRAQRSLDALLDRFPLLAATIENNTEVVTIGQAVERLAGFVASHLVGVLSNSLLLGSQILIMLFLLFFLYRDEEVAIRFFFRLVPLTLAEVDGMVRRLGDTIRAVVLGRILVATMQGTVAGLVFAALGVRAAVILGLLTTVVGLLPPFGAYLIWLPVAIWFAATGHWIKMAILLAAGALIISTLDNFLYPVLVGSRLRQHTVSIFLSLLGGLWLFGLPGLVLGPVVFSATEELLSIWRSRMNILDSLDRGPVISTVVLPREGEPETVERTT